MAGFREAVRLRRRGAGRTQQQLARAIGVHPDVLSHKLNQRSGAMLTTAEVAAIVTTLAEWGAIGSQAEARALLAVMAVPPNAVPAQAWATPPLAGLPPTGPSMAPVLPLPAAPAPGPLPAVMASSEAPSAWAVPAGATSAGAASAGAASAGIASAGAASAGAASAGAASAGAASAGAASAGAASAGAASAGAASAGAGEGTAGPSAAARDGGRLAPVPVPVPVTALVGREAEVAGVVAAVAASRLVTLTGIGGTGKTRVAVRAAAAVAGEFPDGVAFADLAPVDDLDLVAVTLLRALGLTPQSAGAAEEQLIAAVRGARLLLVADNMEHLVEGAPLFGRMLAAAPGLHLLVTSRVALGLYGEHQLRVPPLHLPGQGDPADSIAASEAVQLFIQRARAVVPGFEPQGAALQATAAICAALDGLPLAIELAASWVRLYPPRALLPRLEARLSLLTGGPRNLPQRQQTLRATLDWSDALLPGATRELFARVGVFTGPFDATAAAAVSGAGADPAVVLGQLAELAGHSLLEVTAGEVPGFGLLATVREYALARLAETGQADQVHDRHLRYWLALASQARAGLDGPEQASWLDRLEAEFADIRAALDWARTQGPADGSRLADGLRLATAVAPVWRRRGSLAEGALHLERLLAIDARQHAATPAVRAWALLEACAMACFRGDYPATAEFAGEGLALCEELGDLAGLAWAHRYLGEAALATGDLATAQPHFERQLELGQQAGDRWTEAAARNMLGQVCRYQGSYEAAAAQLRQALRCFESVGDPDGAASTLNSLGEVARDSGEPGQARAWFRRALRGHQQTGSRRGMAADLEGLAGAAALLGADRCALVYFGAAQALREASGGPMLPAEHAILTRLIEAGAAPLTGPDRDSALAEGRNRPLAQVIAEALGS